jgi:hypothetical protein
MKILNRHELNLGIKLNAARLEYREFTKLSRVFAHATPGIPTPNVNPGWPVPSLKRTTLPPAGWVIPRRRAQAQDRLLPTYLRAGSENLER